MQDREESLRQLVTLCRETTDAAPYIIGYLAFRNPDEVLEQAIQSWFEHDETVETMRAANREAEMRQFESPEVPLKSGVETLPS